jgi:hypothetical protein
MIGQIAGPLLARLIKVVRPEAERAALDAVAEIGDQWIELENVGQAGLAELERIGGILRSARRRGPKR